jgi:hypothetical protein
MSEVNGFALRNKAIQPVSYKKPFRITHKVFYKPDGNRLTEQVLKKQSRMIMACTGLSLHK